MKLLLLCFIILFVLCKSVKISEISVKGSHNSYHIASGTYPVSRLPQWDYTHSPLLEQLKNENVRQFEFDFRYDNELTGDAQFPVHHIDTYDEQSHCVNIAACLRVLKSWSDKEGLYQPLIFVHLELKGNDLSVDEWSKFDDTLRSVYEDYRIVKPIDLKIGDMNLHDSATSVNNKWPDVTKTGGMIMFLLEKPYPNYHQGRIYERLAFPMFKYNTKDNINAAVIKINYPSPYWLKLLGKEGFILRTRSDSNTPYGGPWNTSILDQTAFNIIDRDPQDSYLTIDEMKSFLTAFGLSNSKTLIIGLIMSCPHLPYTLSYFQSCVLPKVRPYISHFSAVRYNITRLVENRENAIKYGAHIITTDFPYIRSNVAGSGEFYGVELIHPYICNRLLLTQGLLCNETLIQQATPPEKPNEKAAIEAIIKTKNWFIAIGVTIGFVVLLLIFIYLKRKYNIESYFRLNQSSQLQGDDEIIDEDDVKYEMNELADNQ